VAVAKILPGAGQTSVNDACPATQDTGEPQLALFETATWASRLLMMDPNKATAL